MTTNIGDNVRAEISIKIFEVLPQFLEALPLRGIRGELVETTDPVFAVLPAGETERLYFPKTTDRRMNVNSSADVQWVRHRVVREGTDSANADNPETPANRPPLATRSEIGAPLPGRPAVPKFCALPQTLKPDHVRLSL